MRTLSRPEIHRADGYEIHILGAPAPGLPDLYPALLRASWTVALSVIVGGYLALNALFALLYLLSGGIAHAEPGSFWDAFFFSVQTMGTIGYGAMVPATRLANLLVVTESVTGLIVTALATGLVFSRFSLTRARVAFSSRVAIGPMDGVPTVMIRLGNVRSGAIADATFRLSMVRTTRTQEGVVVYKSEDLPLVRDRAAVLSRSWNVLHRIVPGSPLFGATSESLAREEVELSLAVSGIDETSLQPVHARRVWVDRSIVFGARLADVLSERPDGTMVLDLSRFDELTPIEGGAPAVPAGLRPA